MTIKNKQKWADINLIYLKIFCFGAIFRNLGDDIRLQMQKQILIPTVLIVWSMKYWCLCIAHHFEMFVIGRHKFVVKWLTPNVSVWRQIDLKNNTQKNKIKISTLKKSYNNNNRVCVCVCVYEWLLLWTGAPILNCQPKTPIKVLCVLCLGAL